MVYSAGGIEYRILADKHGQLMITYYQTQKDKSNENFTLRADMQSHFNIIYNKKKVRGNVIVCSPDPKMLPMMKI